MANSRWIMVAALIVAGCTASVDDGLATDAVPKPKRSPESESAPLPATSSTSAPALPPETEGEPTIPDDAGTGAPDAAPSAGARDAFKGAPPFGARTATPSTDTVLPHKLAGGVAGKDCLGCHSANKVAALNPFAAGGTAYLDRAGTMPAVGAEIRIVTSSGTEVAKVSTDAAGNFWIPSGKTEVTVNGTYTGVRDGTGARTMQTALTGGTCNACHDGKIQPRIYLR